VAERRKVFLFVLSASGVCSGFFKFSEGEEEALEWKKSIDVSRLFFLEKALRPERIPK
jgi:hypothetical protein